MHVADTPVLFSEEICRELAEMPGAFGVIKCSLLADGELETEIVGRIQERAAGRFSLTPISEPWSSLPMRGEVGSEFESAIRQRDPDSAMAALVERLLPNMTRQQIRDFEKVLTLAQESPPVDKPQFVEDANRLLDAFRLRVQAEDGERYRFRVLPGATGRGHIQLRDQSKGRGFKSAEIRIVSFERGRPQLA